MTHLPFARPVCGGLFLLLSQISLQFSLVLTLFSYVSCIGCQTSLGPSPSPSSPGLVKTCLFTWMVTHGLPVRGLSSPLRAPWSSLRQHWLLFNLDDCSWVEEWDLRIKARLCSISLAE